MTLRVFECSVCYENIPVRSICLAPYVEEHLKTHKKEYGSMMDMQSAYQKELELLESKYSGRIIDNHFKAVEVTPELKEQYRLKTQLTAKEVIAFMKQGWELGVYRNMGRCWIEKGGIRSRGENRNITRRVANALIDLDLIKLKFKGHFPETYILTKAGQLWDEH